MVDLPAPFGPSRPKTMPALDREAEAVQGVDGLPPAVRLDQVDRLDGGPTGGEWSEVVEDAGRRVHGHGAPSRGAHRTVAGRAGVTQG